MKASLAVVSDRAVVLGDEISIVMCDAQHQFWEPALSRGCPPGLWAGEGRSCSHALVAVRPVTDLLRIANCLLLETLPAFTIA